MRILSMILVGAVVGGLGVGVGFGQVASTKPKGGAPSAPAKMWSPMVAFGGQLREMVLLLKPDAELKAKLEEQNSAMLKSLEEFRGKAMEKAKASVKAINAEVGAPRDKLRQDYAEEVNKDLVDYQALIAVEQGKMDALLSPEQRVLWEKNKLYRWLTGLMRVAPALTDDQKKLIAPMIDAAAQEMAEAKDGGNPAEVNGKLMKKLIDEVLTAEQAGFLFMSNQPTLNGLPPVPGGKAAPMKPKDKDLP